MRQLTIGAFAIAVCLVMASARADDPSRLRLEWNAPAECPTRETVLGRIAELSGALAGEAEVVAHVEVSAPDAGGWSARVSVRRNGHESTRFLTAPSCAEVVAGVVVMIALVLGPTQGLGAVSEPSPAKPTEPTAAPPDVSVVASSCRPSMQRSAKSSSWRSSNR